MNKTNLQNAFETYSTMIKEHENNAKEEIENIEETEEKEVKKKHGKHS